MSEGQFRLVTRSDFDGLVCAVLLRELGMIRETKFVHPKDMQDGIILVDENDITTNVPYMKKVHLAFDHHVSETIRLGETPDNYICNADAPSTARVVYEHFGGRERFPDISEDLLAAVDKSDSARYDRDDILEPSGWTLVGFMMDARTGLGRFKDFKVSNYQLMMTLIDCCRDHSAEEILALSDIRERIDLYNDHKEQFAQQIRRCTKVVDGVGVLDLRDEKTIFSGNRFMIYALYPEIDVSLHVFWGLNRLNTVFAAGKSILQRGNRVNIGALMLEYFGGGHRNAGSCQIDNENADQVLAELVERLHAE